MKMKRSWISTLFAVSMLPAAAPGHAYRVLTDLNQADSSMKTPSNFPVAATGDGLWSLLTNSGGSYGLPIPTATNANGWDTVYNNFSNRTTICEGQVSTWLNGAPAGPSTYQWVVSQGYPIEAIMCYDEANYGSTPTLAEVNSVQAAYPTRSIVINVRSWANSAVQSVALSSAVFGVSFEFNPNGTAVGRPEFNNVQGIKTLLDSGKRVYLLLAPQSVLSPPGNDYEANVEALAASLKNQLGGTRMQSSNFVFVAAAYGRTSTGVNFTPETSTSRPYENTVTGAAKYLIANRNMLQNGFYIAGNHFTIKNRLGGNLLDDFRGGLKSGTLVVQNAAIAGKDTQQWTITVDASGYYVIANRHNGLALNNYGSSLQPGTRVDQGVSNASDSQEWQIVPVNNGYYTFQNRHSGLMLEDYGSSAQPGASVVQNTATGATNQQWIITASD